MRDGSNGQPITADETPKGMTVHSIENYDYDGCTMLTQDENGLRVEAYTMDLAIAAKTLVCLLEWFKRHGFAQVVIPQVNAVQDCLIARIQMIADDRRVPF